MAEYACGALKGKEKKTVYLNFLMQISPACDCYPHNDAPIVRDIGVLISDDPVAIDKASCDLVNNEESMPHTAIKQHLKKGEDKWRALYPAIDWNIQLESCRKAWTWNTGIYPHKDIIRFPFQRRNVPYSPRTLAVIIAMCPNKGNTSMSES